MRDALEDELAPTGTGAVDRALDQLDGLHGRPVQEHVAGLEEVHRLLQEALATLDGV